MHNDLIIYTQAISMNIPHAVAKLIVCQARFESADYTSNSFIHDKNAFGYKWVGQHKWAIGAGIRSTEKDCYARYEKLEDSVGELVDWLRRREKEGKLKIEQLRTPDAYAEALKKCGYYGIAPSTYGNGLEAKMKLLCL